MNNSKKKLNYRIIDTKYANTKKLSIVYYRQRDLYNVIRKSGKLAFNNEIQVNYIALVRQEFYDNGFEINQIIPMIYFNYPQVVTPTSIKFNRADIIDKIKEYLELSKELANQYTTAWDDDMHFITGMKPKEIVYRITYMNNIHKHP